MKCTRCKGPFHPATGDYDRRTGACFCGPCAREFYRWLRGQMGRRIHRG